MYCFIGDDDYPSEPDVIGKKPIPDLPQSLEEMRAKATHMNRLEIRGPTCQAYCNVKLECGPSLALYLPSRPNYSSVIALTNLRVHTILLYLKLYFKIFIQLFLNER